MPSRRHRAASGRVRQEPAAPAERRQTGRHALSAALRDGQWRTARELSELLSMGEREVTAHLQHLQRSAGRRGERLAVQPSACLECGYVFEKRERLSRPSRCARCKSERILPPRFAIPGGR